MKTCIMSTNKHTSTPEVQSYTCFCPQIVPFTTSGLAYKHTEHTQAGLIFSKLPESQQGGGYVIFIAIRN